MTDPAILQAIKEINDQIDKNQAHLREAEDSHNRAYLNGRKSGLVLARALLVAGAMAEDTALD